MPKKLTIHHVTRIEGHARITIHLNDAGTVERTQFHVTQMRGFERFVEGRPFYEMPAITARICGICPVAYQMSSCHAMEDAAGVRVTGQLRELRRLLYCGEWIESHGLHVFMLHAPDFLGYPSAIEMAKDHREVVEMGLKLKKVGNDIGNVLGGREVHPVNVKVGGFYKAPRKRDFAKLAEDLKWAADAAEKTIRWTANLPFPDFEQDYELVSLSHPDEYPMNEGRIISNRGLDIAIADYEEHFEEEHIPYTNALQSVHKGHGAYFVGPMARFALNFDKLTPRCRALAREVGMDPGCRNPFRSIIIRSVELLFSCEEALRVIDAYEPPDAPAIEVNAGGGTGFGCTEAPRGLLYHRYRVDEQGDILEAKIVPPTSQNQKTIENDLRQLVPGFLHLDDEKLQWQCEQTIRNYDPCISCATHFLKIHREEVGA